MAISCFLISAVVMSLFYTGTADFNLSNVDIHDPDRSLQMENIVIDTLQDYLQKQEKRLPTLRKHIQDYSEDHEKAIRKVAQSLNAANRDSSVNDHKEIKEEADKGVINDISQYEKLCRGEILPPANIQKNLKCRYVDRGISFLKIAPFKEEEAYLNPRIVLYHDVLYEEEIEALKRLSKPRLKSATVFDGTSHISQERIAKNVWLYEAESRHVKLLSRRVEHMAGLTVETSEPLQIAYYQIGGFYLPHHDYASKELLHSVEYFEERGIGNRVATVLFYMNDVARGGGTAFTRLNFTLWPKKGSAAFWYNLKRNGEGDISTEHGACPVLYGTKWNNLLGEAWTKRMY